MLLEDALRAVEIVRGFDGPIVDVGSGGGSPGIPIASALPTREVTLLEAERRKCDFLERWAPPNATVVWGRAEEQETDVFGVALAKALGQPPVAAEWTLPAGAAGRSGGAVARPERGPGGGRGRLRASRGRAARGARRARGAPEGRPHAAGLPAPRRRREEAPARLIGGVVPLRRSIRACRDNGGVGRIYALANQKGGVGKTTTAINLAACLAEAGERALVIDLDPQANATSGLGMRANGTSSYDLLDGAPLSELTKHTAFPNLDLVPSKPELAGAVVELAQREDGERYLKQALASGTSQYDFVFLDCPPSLGPLTVNALAAADRVLVPVQAEYYALEGLSQLMQSIDLIRRRLNPSLGIGGVLLTMVDARTRLAADVEAEVRKHFGPLVFRQSVPRSVRLAEAPSHGLPAIAYDRRSAGADAYWKVAMELVERS